jgi:hypothetical protein
MVNIKALNFEGCEKTYSVMKVETLCSSEMSVNLASHP